jgi:lipopolysaccharide transport system permease protein
VDLAIAFMLLVGLMFWYGVRPGTSVMLLPLIVLVIGLAALGVGSALAALNVSYRDFRYVIPFLVQLWMFATPTIYMQTARSGGHGYLSALLVLNPLTGLVAAFRAACCGTPLDWGQLAACSLFAVAAFLGGCLFFRRAEQKFADVI